MHTFLASTDNSPALLSFLFTLPDGIIFIVKLVKKWKTSWCKYAAQCENVLVLWFKKMLLTFKFRHLVSQAL